MRKKALSVVCFMLVIILLASCAPAGRGGGAATPAPGGTVTQPGQATPAPGQQQPAAPERPDLGPHLSEAPWWPDHQEFTMWAAMTRLAGVLPSWEENLVIQTMAEATNTQIRFLHPPVGSETEHFNMMIASGDLPDMIMDGWLGRPGGPAHFIQNNIIIRLNELWDDYAPNALYWFRNVRPEISREIMIDDGTIYTMPSVYYHRDLAVFNGPVIRGDMAAKIGVVWEDFPKTIDQWEEMLVAVRDHPELGGQGVIPFSFNMIQNFNTPLFLGAWGIFQEWYQVDGEVRFGMVQPEYKEFLALMRRWFEMGLIDPEFPANTGAMQDEKVLGDRVFSFIGSMGGHITRYTALARPNNPDFTLLPVHYPTFTPGEIPQVTQETAWFIGGVAITSAARDPARLVRLLDYNFSEQGHQLHNWGIEGVSFEFDEDGNRRFLPVIMDSPRGWARDQAMAAYALWQSQMSNFKKRYELEQRDSLPEQLIGRTFWMQSPNHFLMPPVTPTMDEANEFAGLMVDINAYSREMATNIILGNIDLDDGFQTMVDTLFGMGMERAIELRQAALERFLARPPSI